ncbi:glutamyl-Q tRNA(Asp) synthetase [Sphingomonas jejuensis]|uniref:Glutamyl-Q tRNA(Asp) synthetase n=2 Tax=Sphingomonas jejuensis TaxID=904715 RepID=A0ABX0XQI9_9SPHN|nr:glutamyl-Q tRNA(Asp) synthetase [Sphingomonas jejuensis]
MAHDVARAAGGRFLLRIEDIDGSRSRPEHVAGIHADLAWLELEPDAPPVLQSTRLPVYRAVLDKLRGAGLIYPCFCTRADIAASTSAPHGTAAVYPGTCRHLDPADRDERVATMAHAWRLDMAEALARTGPLRWHDLAVGPIDARPDLAGDVVLARKDAPASYHLAATIDDAWQEIGIVVRGQDLFAATHVHRLLQALLDLPTPAYAHHPLVRGADGRRLAKRDGAAALADLRERGEDAEALKMQLRQTMREAGFDPRPSYI